jgi:hypothetical protein
MFSGVDVVVFHRLKVMDGLLTSSREEGHVSQNKMNPLKKGRSKLGFGHQFLSHQSFTSWHKEGSYSKIMNYCLELKIVGSNPRPGVRHQRI